MVVPLAMTLVVGRGCNAQRPGIVVVPICFPVPHVVVPICFLVPQDRVGGRSRLGGVVMSKETMVCI